MSWGSDHNHSGDYAPVQHNHDSYDVYGVAGEHHDHSGTYSQTGHDHDQGDIWSAITDLQNTVQDLRTRVATLAALAAHEAAQ